MGLYDEDRYDPQSRRSWIRSGTGHCHRGQPSIHRAGAHSQRRSLGEDKGPFPAHDETPLRGSYQIGSLSSFDLSTPRDIITLWIKRSVANGIKSFWICDYQTDMEKFVYFARIAKAEGAEVVPALMYTSSPAHTNEHWARKVQLLAEAKDCVDRIMIEDASGVITPEAHQRS